MDFIGSAIGQTEKLLVQSCVCMESTRQVATVSRKAVFCRCITNHQNEQQTFSSEGMIEGTLVFCNTDSVTKHLA